MLESTDEMQSALSYPSDSEASSTQQETSLLSIKSWSDETMEALGAILGSDEDSDFFVDFASSLLLTKPHETIVIAPARDGEQLAIREIEKKVLESIIQKRPVGDLQFPSADETVEAIECSLFRVNRCALAYNNLALDQKFTERKDEHKPLVIYAKANILGLLICVVYSVKSVAVDQLIGFVLKWPFDVLMDVHDASIQLEMKAVQLITALAAAHRSDSRSIVFVYHRITFNQIVQKNRAKYYAAGASQPTKREFFDEQLNSIVEWEPKMKRAPFSSICIFGGWIGAAPTKRMNLLNTYTEKWTYKMNREVHSMDSVPPLSFYGATYLSRFGAEGTIFVAGGFSNGYTFSQTVYSIDVNRFVGHSNHSRSSRSLQSWSKERAMHLTSPRCYCSLVGISDDRLLLCGGFNTVERVATTEIFELGSKDGWTEVCEMNCRRLVFAREISTRLFRSDSASALIDGKVYMAGGYDGANLHDTVEVYNPQVNKWSLLESKMSTRRSASSAVECRGVLVVAGGQEVTRRTNAVEFYDPREGRWLKVTPMMSARLAGTGCADSQFSVQISVSVFSETIRLLSVAAFTTDRFPNASHSIGVLIAGSRPLHCQLRVPDSKPFVWTSSVRSRCLASINLSFDIKTFDGLVFIQQTGSQECSLEQCARQVAPQTVCWYLLGTR
ncbi:Kelch repeat and BTB domain-containing protein F47D12.7 [Aphelenchoides besseyi]|nr:Kelch repeat and BTB domain-containing protein F47D12.7 [Aphelenchoides besseyi]